ncbi:hypothetical protein [Stakelama marina]|uniref:LPXTG cell wall anchor domain-containing protein n=1 Tax=Stakelama marina TaxID=2826939 RepID=A0A8T4IAB7_9SPHN|nr:hypothetical protein [Stakelama marina]MBR0551082.1 hypothetical protein [Stakelama marina]
MTQAHKSSYLAGAAIAAALASVATPAMAQDMAATPQSTPDAVTPGTVAPPDLSGLAAPDMASDRPSQSSAPVADPPAVLATESTAPASETPAALASEVPNEAPVTEEQATAPAKPVTERTASSKATAAPQPKARTATASEDNPPADAAPISQQDATSGPPVQQTVSTPAAARPEGSSAQQSLRPDNNALLWIGLAGAAVVIAGLAAAMVMRRKRTAPIVEPQRNRAYEAPATDVASKEAVEPSFVRPQPVVAPAAAVGAQDGLGRHERAALAGPTPDNPFLTLKKRLARARFYDRRERLAAEAAGRPAEMPWAASERAAETAPQRATPRPNARPATNPLNWTKGGLRPAFDS